MIGQNPSFTVSEFVAIFNQSLEMMYPQVSVTGEISNFKNWKDMYIYFDLKEDDFVVSFFGPVSVMPGPLENGMMCEVIGRPRLHKKNGFSIVVDSILATGEGSIKKAQDLLKKKLDAEGLFEYSKKRELPYPPLSVGVVTSAQGAAIADFRKVVKARWPSLRIELTSTLVQGANAPREIVKAIQDFNTQSNPPEVLVIIRGGGSADDLAAFSEESVVRAVAASRIPTMVAIGHETDLSLAEMAADKRASTPSNAAELLVPSYENERILASRLRQNLDQAMLDRYFEEENYILEQREDLQEYMKSILAQNLNHLSNSKVLFKALDPLSPLKMGYALVRNSSGKHIKRASEISKSEVFSIEFTDEKKQARLVEK